MAYERDQRFRSRPRRPLRGLLLLGGITLLVCCVGVTGFGAWNFQAIRQATDPARKAADGFLRALTGGDVTGAYDRLCGETRDRWGPEDFTRWVSTPPTVSGYLILDVSVRSVKGQLRATAATRLTRTTGAVDEHPMPVVREGKHWRICGDPY